MPLFSPCKAPSGQPTLPSQLTHTMGNKPGAPLSFVGVNTSWKAVCVCERHRGVPLARLPPGHGALAAPAQSWFPSPRPHAASALHPSNVVLKFNPKWRNLVPPLVHTWLRSPAKGYNLSEGDRQAARDGPASGGFREPAAEPGVTFSKTL